MLDPFWPSFLDRLDTDPKAAQIDFYRFLEWTLNRVPPEPMRSLCKEQQEDVKQEVFLHCIQEDCRVLRQYVNRGKPFAAWLYTVARNVCVDHIRKKKPRKEEVSIHEGSNGTGLENILANPADVLKRQVIARYIPIVKKMIERLDEHCRILLEMAADEFTPKEMALVLGLPASQNKKISDDLRYCREKLRKRLAEAGIDIGSILES